jgi:hypothetical protein
LELLFAAALDGDTNSSAHLLVEGPYVVVTNPGLGATLDPHLQSSHCELPTPREI